MLSVLKPPQNADPAVKKEITLLSFLFVPCWIGLIALLLAVFFTNPPPSWVRVALPLVTLLAAFIGGRIYSLRNPRQAASH
jgi:hypothetical protein